MSIIRTEADAASFVWSDGTRWPVSDDSMAVRAVSRSRISSIVGIEAQERSLRSRTSRGLGVDLDLLHTVGAVLDRILDRHDRTVRCVQFLQRGV